MISLIGQNEEPLRQAFEVFADWSRRSGPDSVQLTFIFRRDGGYTVGVGPEPTRLAHRCFGFERTYQVLAVSGFWIKRLDTTHSLVRSFRSYCDQPISPFLFAGITALTGKLHPPPAPANIRPVDGLAPLLKLEATFLDEDDAEPGSLASVALNSSPGSSQITAADPPTPTPDEIARQRRSNLRRHFPVTLERLATRSSTAPTHVSPDEKVATWQVEQAICNLVLAKDMGLRPHYLGLPRNGEERILQALSNRFELADGTVLHIPPIETLLTQILADGNMLLRHLRHREVKTFPDLQAFLNRLELIDPNTRFWEQAKEEAT